MSHTPEQLREIEEGWHPQGFDAWWAREMEYQGFTSAHDGARRAWHECSRAHAAALEEINALTIDRDNYASKYAAMREELARLRAPVEVAGLVNELLGSVCFASTTKEWPSDTPECDASQVLVELWVNGHRREQSTPAIEAAVARRLERERNALAAQLAERDAEIAALKGHANAMAAWLETIVEPNPLTFDARWLDAYRAAYPKEADK